MLHTLVGNVDIPAAFVLVSIFLSIGIAYSVHRTTPRKTDKDYKLEELKMEKDAAYNKLRYELDHNYQVKKLEQNLITSHKEIEFGSSIG